MTAVQSQEWRQTSSCDSPPRVDGLKLYCTAEPTSLFLPAWRLMLHPGAALLPDVVFSLLLQLIGMASSDDPEGSLTPVDFIQLQQYMECRSPPHSARMPLDPLTMFTKHNNLTYFDLLSFVILVTMIMMILSLVINTYLIYNISCNRLELGRMDIPPTLMYQE